jgi:glycosyltransferase involved in cell wall biosynthesis
MLLHSLNLNVPAGVEQLFSNYLQSSILSNHTVLINGKKEHPSLSDSLKSAAHVGYLRYYAGSKWIRRPSLLRKRYLTNFLKKHRPSKFILWNCLDEKNLSSVIRSEQPGSTIIYYDHGASWFIPKSKASALFQGINRVICISRASEKMLKYRLQCPLDTMIIPNALRKSLPVRCTHRRGLQKPGNLIIGFAGRLVPVKGAICALMALRELKQMGCQASLIIAGAGPDMPALKAFSRKMGSGFDIQFLGNCPDMAAYYDSIDILLIPSAREPFGLVALEAAARGCPVVASNIDGLPEAVEAGQTGLLVKPSMDIKDLSLSLSGSANWPEFVYDPEMDQLVCPRLPDPRHLAEAVKAIIRSNDCYESYSKAALERVSKYFGFDSYVKKLDQTFLETE